jgi:hypothetical protein
MFRFVGSDAVGGTSLRGYVLAEFATLVQKLGSPPTTGPETPAEWTLQFDDGTISTLYCYKCGRIPTGIHMWHVGGHSAKAVLQLASALGSELLDLSDDGFELFFHRLRRQEQQLATTYAWANPSTAAPDADGEEIPF